MIKKLHIAAFAAALLLAGGAQALTVGNIDVQSGLGQRLNATIPVTLGTGEDIAQGCVRLEDPVNSQHKNVPAILNYSLVIERSGKDAVIRITTPKPVDEPVVRVGLIIRCGAKMSTTREFVVTQKLSSADKK